MIRRSQVDKILAAHRCVSRELRSGDVTSLTRAVAVLYAAQRNASFEENQQAAFLRIAELHLAN